MKYKILNLGCGNKPMENAINIDKNPKTKPDIILNLERKLPFKNNSVEAVHANHILAHLRDVYKVMDEVYRVCKNGAKIYIEVPYYKSPLAFTNLEHKHFFTEKTFEYCFNTAKEDNEFRNYVKYRFSIDSMKLIKEKHRFLPGLLCPVDSIRVVLTVVKK